MKLIVEFPEIDLARRKIGASLSNWGLNQRPLNDRERLIIELEEGKEIPLEDVTPVHGGLLSVKGEQVLLYIKDTRQDKDTLLYDPENARRFHIFECRTLNDMRRNGRFERYVVTTNRSGVFGVEATDPHSGNITNHEVELLVCKNCIKDLNWNKFAEFAGAEKKGIWLSFSIEDFFSEFATFFSSKPTHTDITAPPGGYVKKWKSIATSYKELRNWRCTSCGVDLSKHPMLLHAHHENGVLSDNSEANIKVLCVLCHAEKPYHSRVKPTPKNEHLIKKLRIEQH